MSKLIDDVKHAIGLGEDDAQAALKAAQAKAEVAEAAAKAAEEKAQAVVAAAESAAKAQVAQTEGAVKADVAAVEGKAGEVVDKAKTLEKQLPVTVWMRLGEMETHALTILHQAEQVVQDALHSEEKALLDEMQKAMQHVREVGLKIHEWSKKPK